MVLIMVVRVMTLVAVKIAQGGGGVNLPKYPSPRGTTTMTTATTVVKTSLKT